MGDNSFSEAFKELDALYAEDLIQAYGDFRGANLVTTYKGYDIYRYSDENKPPRRNANGVLEYYTDKYYGEDDRGTKIAIASTSIEDCKKRIDAYLRETEHEQRLEKAKKLLGTCVATYRGCSICYKKVEDLDKGTYTYSVQGNTRRADYVVSDIAEDSFKSVDLAKKAIDECIREWNSYADDSSVYKESFKRFIREQLAALDAQE